MLRGILTGDSLLICIPHGHIRLFYTHELPKELYFRENNEDDRIQLLYAVNEMTISGFQADIDRPPKEKKHIQIKS